MPPDPPAVARSVVVESTYGDRLHPVPDPERLAGAVRRTAKRGGSVLIPAFAGDRKELVLLALHDLLLDDRIPRLPVYVDSPMALAALDVYQRALRSGSSEIRPDVASAALAARIRGDLGWRAVVPRLDERVRLARDPE